MSGAAGSSSERSSGRPARYEDLLSTPIIATSGETASYDGWEFDHVESVRFYVGGFRWFMRSAAMFDLSKISDYAAAGVAIAQGTTWTSAGAPEGDWKSCSVNQFRAAKDIKPVQFAKAALVIATCEAIVAEGLKSGKFDASKLSIDSLYEHMSIIPAVWSLAQISKGAFDKLEGSKVEAILQGTGQTNPKLLEEVAIGHTVTLNTALKIKSYVDQNLPNIPTGIVTSRRAGARNASTSELLA